MTYDCHDLPTGNLMLTLIAIDDDDRCQTSFYDFDFDAVAAEATRRRIYDRVATDRIRITGYHFPFPANGYLAKEGSGYRFIAADWSGAV